jgi:hypothetical protein
VKRTLCGGCGTRRALILINPLRSPHSRAAATRKRVAIRGHDLCRLCWRAIVEPILTAAHVARLEARRVA